MGSGTYVLIQVVINLPTCKSTFLSTSTKSQLSSHLHIYVPRKARAALHPTRSSIRGKHASRFAPGFHLLSARTFSPTITAAAAIPTPRYLLRRCGCVHRRDMGRASVEWPRHVWAADRVGCQ